MSESKKMPRDELHARAGGRTSQWRSLAKSPKGPLRLHQGQTLVASLIVIAIIGILAIVMLKGSGTFGSSSESEKARPDGRGGTLPGLVKASAEDTVCRSNLGQVRMAIDMQRTTDDSPPASIEDTRLGESFYKCPMGQEKYQYDASTGKVFCPHLGHEKY